MCEKVSYITFNTFKNNYNINLNTLKRFLSTLCRKIITNVKKKLRIKMLLCPFAHGLYTFYLLE